MHCQKEDKICPEVTRSPLQSSPRVLRKPTGESRAGHRLGKLRPDGSQMLHGRGTHPIGGAGFDKHGDWLVQAFPNFLYGGSHNDTTDSTLLAALSGEHCGTVLWTFLRPLTWLSFISGRALNALYPKSAGCAWLRHRNPLECSRISKTSEQINFWNIPECITEGMLFISLCQETSGQAKNADQTSGLWFSFTH